MHLVGENNDGWLDYSILTFIVELLNFYATYNLKSRSFDGVIPSIVFGNPDDTHLSVNPNLTEYNHLKNVSRCKDTKDKELHNQFCNQNHQFLMSPGHKGESLCDTINFFTKVGKRFKTHAVPLNWCGLHWVLLHIVVRSTKKENGKVSVFDHSDYNLKQFHQDYFHRMWYAKKCGVVDKVLEGYDEKDIYFGANDMSPKHFQVPPGSHGHSSLNYTSKNQVHHVLQVDGSSCGLFVIIEMVELITKKNNLDRL